VTEKKTNVITINGKSYTKDQLTDEQKEMVNHIADLERKARSAQFQLTQLQVGTMGFLNMLESSLEAAE
jgi:hypothetical protein